MALKLTAREIADRDDLIRALREEGATLHAAVSEFEGKYGEMCEALQAAVEEYNGRLADVRQWRDDVHTRLDEELDGKSDKWKEGERGGSAVEWVEAFGALDLDDIELDPPDPPDPPDLEHADHVEEIETEPSEG